MNLLSDEAKYLFVGILRKYPAILEEIKVRKYTVADTGISSRNINTIDNAGLLPKIRATETQWRKFNLNELLYLAVIRTCRNLSNEKLAKFMPLFFEEKTNYKDIGPIGPSEMALVVMFTQTVPLYIQVDKKEHPVLADKLVFPFGTGLFLDLNNIFGHKIIELTNSEGFKSKFNLDEFENDYQLKPISRQLKTLIRIVKENDFSKITISKKPDGTMVVEGQRTEEGNRLTEEDLKKLEEVDYGRVEKIKQNGKLVKVIVTDSYKI